MRCKSGCYFLERRWWLADRLKAVFQRKIAFCEVSERESSEEKGVISVQKKVLSLTWSCMLSMISESA